MKNGLDALKTSPTPLQLLIKEMPGENLPSFPYLSSMQLHYSGTRNAASELTCDLDRIKNILHCIMLCENMVISLQ